MPISPVAKPEKVLGIDPGYERVGFAVIERARPRERVVVSGCFHTSPQSSFPERLAAIGDEIERLISKYSPDALGIETLFLDTNAKTAMRVAEARGVIVYAASRQNLRVLEYAPLEIKLAVTGYGRADKAQVAAMIRRLTELASEPKLDDEYDAIAVAVTALARG